MKEGKEGRSWRFTHAVSRLPGKSIANGLRAGGGADPDPAELVEIYSADRFSRACQIIEAAGGKVED